MMKLGTMKVTLARVIVIVDINKRACQAVTWPTLMIRNAKPWFCAVSILFTVLSQGQVDHPHAMLGSDSAFSIQSEETRRMVETLQALVRDGDPANYYHWNSRLAEQLKARLGQGTMTEQRSTWYFYCQQLLYAGQSQACINELEQYLHQLDRPYPELLTDVTRPLFELLALAYLRLGEQQNCQLHHTPQSCIVPFKEGAIHKLKVGSQNAIELYTLLMDRYPSEKNKWLLNIAYMTLGLHPQSVPEVYLIDIPNYETERQTFPDFQDIAMRLGVAVNGLSGGVCVEDFNNDGFLDIFTTSYGMEDNVQLFFSDMDGGFINVTQTAGLQGIVSGLNCLHADYDNDGFRDILILRGAWLGKGGAHPNSLLRNMGNGTFQDVTESSGLLSYHPTQTASWGDFDKDGHLDLFIGNESQGDQLHACELYRNNGNGTFSEVASQHGLGQIRGYVKGCVWGDINNDGWMDLYVSVLGGYNLLFKNEEGHFKEISLTAGVVQPVFSFPCWFWDVNNDGLEDIFVSGYDAAHLDDLAGDYAKELQGLPVSTAKPKLYLNNGDETFREVSERYGIDRTMYSMGSNYGDLDNDGLLDFYVGTGAPGLTTIVPNRMFRNVSGSSFEEVTSAGNFGHIQKGHGVAFADFDRDGDQDIYAVVGGALEGDTFTNILYENPISDNNWIIIELQGSETSKDAIGTRLELSLDDGRKLYRTISTGGSFGASPLQQEIGLGQALSIETLIVHWTNSQPQTFEDIEVNRRIRIKEGRDAIESTSYNHTPFKLKHVHNH